LVSNSWFSSRGAISPGVLAQLPRSPRAERVENDKNNPQGQPPLQKTAEAIPSRVDFLVSAHLCA